MMKMLYSTLLSLAAAGVACAGQTVTVTPPPPIAPPPLPATPVADSSWYAEAAGFVGHSNRNIVKNIENTTHSPKRVDIIGGDVTVGYRLDEMNALQLRLGYGYGVDDSRDTRFFNEYNKKKIRAHTFTLMPGYRLTHKLDSSWDLFAAVHAGVGNESLKYSDQFFGENYSSPAVNSHKSQWGFAYSAEVGVRYHITDGLYTFLSYEFRGSTANPTINTPYNGDITTREQTYHVIRLGMGCNF